MGEEPPLVGVAVNRMVDPVLHTLATLVANVTEAAALGLMVIFGVRLAEPEPLVHEYPTDTLIVLGKLPVVHLTLTEVYPPPV